MKNKPIFEDSEEIDWKSIKEILDK